MNSYATYNGNGTIATSTDVNGAVTNYHYDGTGGCNNLLLTSTNLPVNNLSTSQTWNCNGGVVVSSTDANGVTTSNVLQFDALWRPIQVQDALGNVTSSTYLPNSVESSMSFNSGKSGVDSLTTLDGLGRPILSQKLVAPGSNLYDSVATTYDVMGRASQQSIPYQTAKGQVLSGIPTVNTTYDALDRPLQATDANGGYTQQGYAGMDVLTTAGPAPSGENAKLKQMESNALGQLTSVCEITSGSGSGTCAQSTAKTGYWTKYTYNALGNLLTVTQNAQTGGSTQSRTYHYDGLGRMTSEINPENGTTTYTYDTADASCNNSQSYNGDLVEKTDAVGNITCYRYDAIHRLVSQTYTHVSGASAYDAYTSDKYFVYDSAIVNGATMGYSAGHLAEAYTVAHQAGSGGTKITDEGFSYTTRGETYVVYQKTPNSGGYYTVQQDVYANGAPQDLSASLNGGSIGIPNVSYGLDGEGRLKSVTDTTHGLSLVTSATYNAAGSPVEVGFGNGDKDSFYYDGNTSHLTGSVTSLRGSCPASFTSTLTWNPLGTLEGLSTTDSTASTNNQSCSYHADDLSRIASVSCTSWAQSFTYDAFGNVTKSGNQSYMPGYNSKNQALTASYDLNGNSTNDGLSGIYGWDADNHTISISGIASIPSITYDALGRTVEINSGSIKQILYGPDGSKLAVLNGSTLLKGIIPLPGGATAVYTANAGGLDHLRHPDWLGSSRVGTKWDHTVYSRETYAPFGETYNESGTVDRSFTSQDQDTVSGVYDFLYRRYHPVQGRWISPDPSGMVAVSPSNPQSWNRYVYVLNNPLSLADSLGLYCKWDDGSKDDEPVDGGASYQECVDQAGTWNDTTSVTVVSDPYELDTIAIYKENGVYIGGTFTGLSVSSSSPCWTPNFLQRWEIAGLSKIASVLNEAVGIGAGGSWGAGMKQGFGFYTTGSAQLVVDKYGSATLNYSHGGTGSHLQILTPVSKGIGWNVGLQLGLYPTAPTPGKSVSVDVSAGGGAEVALAQDLNIDPSLDPSKASLTTTVGIGAGEFGRAGAVVTTNTYSQCKTQ